MGHGNNSTPKVEYTTALAEGKKPSAQEEALGKASLKTLDWADKGDYTDPHEGGLFVNYADPALLHRNRELQANAGSQGIYALGTADPNYLATVKSAQAAEDEQADSAQYEHDIQTGVANAAGYAGDVARLDQARKMNVLGTTADLYKVNQQKPKWWQYLIQGASAAGSAALSNPAIAA